MRSHTYRTRQKEMILDCLRNNSDRHMTAEEIFELLRSENTGIGKATVYRHLDRLVNDNIVRRFTAGDEFCSFYQINDCGPETECLRHFHIKCSRCGKLEHLDCDKVNCFFDHIQAEHGFTVDARRTVFYGLCRECRNKGNV